MTETQDPALFDVKSGQMICRGDWDINHFSALKTHLNQVTWPESGDITIDGKAIKRMDSAGAWLLSKWQMELEKKGIKANFAQFKKEYTDLLALIKKETQAEKAHSPDKRPSWISLVGMYSIDSIIQFRNFLTFIGYLSHEFLRLLKTPSRWRINSITHIIYLNGFLALPIIALLSFMIGVVITYQMGLQLQNYGANIFIVDLLGLAVLREFGPLMTAIMVAGRTGSAFTAQLGMMKLNQEIDAINTLGVTPAELLLLPRIIGLLIALPLLTIWADIFGVFGGMVMAKNMLDITWYDFMHRFPNVIPLRTILIGLGKTPVFALIIASVGCFQGMDVENSAESVGRNTTRSVVLAIFFIIVFDAIFSVILSKLKL